MESKNWIFFKMSPVDNTNKFLSRKTSLIAFYCPSVCQFVSFLNSFSKFVSLQLADFQLIFFSTNVWLDNAKVSLHCYGIWLAHARQIK
jgi:hypothetical protein